jgi:hypothetical protein
MVTEFYKQFLQSDTAIKSQAVLQGLAVTEQLKKLTEGEFCSEDFLFISVTQVF